MNCYPDFQTRGTRMFKLFIPFCFRQTMLLSFVYIFHFQR